MPERSAAATVEVDVDPMRAFAAFTEEIDDWWVRGPINFFDSARAVAMRIEPGVGGRVLEIYDEGRGDVLELGKITAWEPGEQLAYRSSVDDTEVEVRFEASGEGTRVHVTQRLLPEGEQAFFFWPNVIRWLESWCNGTAPGRGELARVSIGLYYRDPAEAARWLERVFKLGSWSGIPAEGEEPEWIELNHGNVSILLFPLDGESGGPVTHVPWVYVDDLTSHFAHAKASGAVIVSEIHQHGYRAYTAEDLEGRHWNFVQARPTMT